MKIKEITFEMGNDFAAVLECEHCNATQKESSGYHDNYYHTRVVPAITCKACGKNRAGSAGKPNPADSEKEMLSDNYGE